MCLSMVSVHQHDLFQEKATVINDSWTKPLEKQSSGLGDTSTCIDAHQTQPAPTGVPACPPWSTAGRDDVHITQVFLAINRHRSTTLWHPPFYNNARHSQWSRVDADVICRSTSAFFLGKCKFLQEFKKTNCNYTEYTCWHHIHLAEGHRKTQRPLHGDLILFIVSIPNSVDDASRCAQKILVENKHEWKMICIYNI